MILLFLASALCEAATAILCILTQRTFKKPQFTFIKIPFKKTKNKQTPLLFVLCILVLILFYARFLFLYSIGYKGIKGEIRSIKGEIRSSLREKSAVIKGEIRSIKGVLFTCSGRLFYNLLEQEEKA